MPVTAFALPLLALVAAMSLVAFTAFALDKRRAERSARRIPERTLLLLALFGGSPGAVLGQRWLRHKTHKQPFKTWLAMIVAGQIAALAAALYLVV